MIEDLLRIVNTVRTNKGQYEVTDLSRDMTLRGDFGFDSLDLAELTVRIEKETGVDIFSDGLVNTIGDVLTKLEKR